MVDKKWLLLIFSVLHFNVVSAQISEKTIGHLNHYPQISQRAFQNSDTLNLPFWDDFSRSKNNTIDTTIWLHGLGVFINGFEGYLPPSEMVATLDGFDGNGNAYSNDTQAQGLGDSLVSKPIDLSGYTAASNIVLSFFWQEKFGNQAPNFNDSLRLSFKNSDNEWEQVFSRGGNGVANPILFQQQFVRVNQERFIHSGFQFKFELLSNLAGAFDVFNLDYIYLNEGNISVNTDNNAYDSYEDRTFSKAPQSIFGDYYALPLKHLNETWLEDNLQSTSFIYNNLWAGDANNPLFVTEIFGILRDTLKPNIILDSLLINGNFLTQNQDTALFTAQSRNREQLISKLIQESENEDSVFLELQLNLGTNDSLFFETINSVRIYYPDLTFRSNDTISTIYPLHNYYAQDDGTAESAIQLNSKNYQIAQEFEIIGDHYMTGIDMYIPNSAQNTGTRNITLLVWDELTNNLSNIRLAQNVLVNQSSGINKFQRFEFERPIFIGGRIYIGYREENDEVVSVGFDKNSNSAENLFFNQSGDWRQNVLLSGSMMIRPVFDEASVTVSNQPTQTQEPFKIYPNPNNGTLNYHGEFDRMEVYSMSGQRMLQINGGENRNSFIHIGHLTDGLYLVKIIKGNSISTQKVLLRK
jgi:hypothetical protein